MEDSDRRTRGKGRRAGLAAFALILGTVLALLIGEVGLRKSRLYASGSELRGGEFVQPQDFSKFRLPWIGFDQGVWAVFQVNQREFQHTVRTNGEGVRDKDHPQDKPEGEFRVVVLGDSFTSGHGVDWEQSYVSVLQEELSERHPDRSVRVMAGGVPGHDPVFSYHLLVQRLLKYQPDLVILAVNGSDLYEVAIRGGMDRFDKAGFIHPVRPALFSRLIARSHLFRALLMSMGLELGRLEGFRGPMEDEIELATERIGEAAARFESLGAERAFQFLMVLHPHAQEVAPGNCRQTLRDWEGFREQGKTKGFAVAEVASGFCREISAGRLEDYFFMEDAHYTALGYRLFGNALADEVDRLGVLQEGPALR